jgi:hypothetical protein
MLALPLWLLYELGIILARFVGVAPPRDAFPVPVPVPASEVATTTTASENPPSDADLDRVIADIDRQTSGK